MTTVALDHLDQRSRPWLWLTLPLAILLLVATGVSIITQDLYKTDSDLLEVQLISQDYFVLVIVIPLLIGSAWRARRGSQRALVVWLGTLLYLIYAYLIFAFCVQFNALFPVYVAVLGCSLYGLLLALMDTDFTLAKALYGEATPVRFFAGMLGLMVVLFYVLQLGEVLPAVFSGDKPTTVFDLNLPTDYTSVIDMAIYLPATGLAAWWLWQKHPIGYVFGGAIFVIYAIMMSMLTLTFIVESARDFDVLLEDFVIIAAVAVLWIGITIRYLIRLKQ